MVSLDIRPAGEDDVDAIKALLTGNTLPTDGVSDHWRTFLVVLDGHQVVACGGAELYPSAALIRSLAVAESHRNRGLGERILRQLIEVVRGNGVRRIYLLTTTAASYFRTRGFTEIPRSEIHPELLASRELQGACPATAVCMEMKIQ